MSFGSLLRHQANQGIEQKSKNQEIEEGKDLGNKIIEKKKTGKQVGR